MLASVVTAQIGSKSDMFHQDQVGLPFNRIFLKVQLYMEHHMIVQMLGVFNLII